MISSQIEQEMNDVLRKGDLEAIRSFVANLGRDEILAFAVRNYVGCEIVHGDCDPCEQSDLDDSVKCHRDNCSRMNDNALRIVIVDKRPDVVLDSLNGVLDCYQGYQDACQKIGFNG